MADERVEPGRARRTVLRTAGALLGGGFLAGCVSRSDTADGRDTEPATEGDSTPTGGDSRGPPTEPAAIPYDVSVDHDLTAWAGYDPDWQAPTAAPPAADYTFEVLVENLAIPWDLSVRDAGRLFLTERPGRLLAFEGGQLQDVARPGDVIDAEAIAPGAEHTGWHIEGGEGGLLGVAVHPRFPDPPLVYTYFTAETEAGRENRVVAVDVRADDPAAATWPIVTGIPSDVYHNGGRIEFGPANYLWIATGDGDHRLDEPATIRSPSTLRGKILRVKPDGTPPADNPDLGPDADPCVYSIGHRNPQGISWLPDGAPVVTEHGPGEGDEVSVLAPGRDYGWPAVRNDPAFESYGDSDVHPPVADAPKWAPSGSVFYTGDALPELRHRLLFGGLYSQQVLACTLVADGTPSAGHDRRHDADWLNQSYAAATSGLLQDELGRVRHVEQGPDGALYAITSNRDGRARGGFPTGRDDKLVRIERERT